ncbi:MAG: LysR substrate-binding domain-containing protein [Bacteroidales bacterium]|nr:LysR substrate-binding domain-containing protein [Bacteroidales bacterium]
MTLQQLEYIIAVDNYRHFVKAADSCGITQPTLSSMIRKLEEELDVVIFDRNSHPVRPTIAGEEVLRQARMVVYHAKQLQETSLSEKKRASGNIHIGITPTIAPYIIPKLFHRVNDNPDITMQASELHRNVLIDKLKNAELDMAIMSCPHEVEGLLSVPLYREKFFAYVSPSDPLYQQESICSRTMPSERLWALKHEISFQLQVSEFCDQESQRSLLYESGSVATLLHIVNENEGFTIIPELHIPMIREEHRCNLRPLVDPVPVRNVSLFIRNDYVREALLNFVVNAIKTIVPEHMIDEHLLKYPVRL